MCKLLPKIVALKSDPKLAKARPQEAVIATKGCN